MADSTIAVELVKLTSGQWGPCVEFNMIPDGGFASTGTTGKSGGFNSATAIWPVGTTIGVYQDGVTAGVKGVTELTYLQVGTQNAAVAIAAGSVCTQDSATDPNVITNDPDDCLLLEGGLCAIALGAVADASYAWFWTGGVAPEGTELFGDAASPLTSCGAGDAGVIITDSTAVAGPKNIVSNCSADVLGLGVGGSDEFITAHLLADDA